MEKKRCGLLGRKLGHSYSPELHALMGEYSYELFEVEPEGLNEFLRARDFDGVNVTIPYKTLVLDGCDHLTEAAQAIGSVNTVVKLPDGSLLGDNTDAAGFEAMIWHSRVPVTGRKCLVLGSGGASLAVRYVLERLGAGEIVTVSRIGRDNYDNLDRHADGEVIVNATPVGMYPETGGAPVDLRRFPRCKGVLDLIYNPARTALLRQAEELGIPCLGGLYMLVEQARCAARIFQGGGAPLMRTGTACQIMRSRKENRVLIGMPGCGKTTVGQAWPGCWTAPSWTATWSWRRLWGPPASGSCWSRGRRPSGPGRPRSWRSWGWSPAWSSPPAAAASPGRRTIRSSTRTAC